MTSAFHDAVWLNNWRGHERFASNGHQWYWVTVDQWVDLFSFTALTWPG